MPNSPVTKPWSNVCALLDPDFGIAPDVTFKIHPTEGGPPGEVKAHRLIIGFLSPVFRNQFFGPSKDTEDVISVEGTTKKAFETMINFIYGKEIDWEVMSLEELFDVVNMAEFYILPEFMEEIKNVIEDYDLTDENLIEAASIAEAFSHFEKPSTALMNHCQNFVVEKIKTVQDAVEFACKHASTKFEGLALKLLASMKNHICSNCRSNPCKDGMLVKDFETLTVGCVIKTTDEDQGYWVDGSRNKSCKIAELNFEEKKIKVIFKNTGKLDKKRLLERDGRWRWRYECKSG